MPRRKNHKKGGGWFGQDDTGPGPVNTLRSKLPSWLGGPSASPATAPASPLTAAPEPVKTAVTEGSQMAQTAGKRIKKHVGINPSSSKDVRKLLKTAKGDNMLGRRKHKTSRRRR
jgi:hypothetical protein